MGERPTIQLARHHTMNLESYTTTLFPAFSMEARALFADGIRLNEFEELISNSNVTSGNNNESDSDDVTVQIADCNLSGC